MQDDLKFYHLSGKANIMGPAFGIILGSVIALPLSFVYAYAVRYIPFIYLNFLVSLGYAFCICFGYIGGEKLGQNRNRFLSFLGVLVMTTIALYFAWVAFLFVISEHKIPYWGLLFNPRDVWDCIEEITKIGWFSLGSSDATVKGIFYGILLVAEALGYLWFFASVAVLDAASVFCEECSKWLDPVAMPSTISHKLENAMQETAETGTISWIDQLELTHEPPMIILSLTNCDQCNRLATISATKVNIVVKDQKTDKEETKLFQNLLLDNHTREKLLKKLEELQIEQNQKEKEMLEKQQKN